MSTTTMLTQAFRIGDAVTHPARGAGKIATIEYDFRGQQCRAWVEFPFCGTVRKHHCWIRDLLPAPAVGAPRPPLRVVEALEPVVA